MMRVHRFMSEAEYDCLISGAKLMNATDHASRGQKTDSVGFCFFTEDPDEAIHWLSGIVTTDRCVTLDIPDELLTESTGEYRDPDKDEYTENMGFFAALMMPCPKMKKREYCTTSYSLAQGIEVVGMTRKYADYAQIRREFVSMGLMEP